MFFFLAFFAIGFILTAFLAPKMKVENAKAAGLDEFKFPRSEEGSPVGRFYGTLKLLSPNTIAITGYRAVPIKKKVKTGIFSSKTIITGYRYYLTVDLAWALGPGVVYRKMWFGNNLVWAGCLYDSTCLNVIPINLPELYGGSDDGNRGGIFGDVAMYCGDFDQDRDEYLVANMNPNVPAYVGVAHMVFRDFWWGNSPSIDTVAVEGAYFVNSLGVTAGRHIMPNGLDMNPVCVLYDILCEDWGNLGYDPARINVTQWREIAIKIFDENNGISISVATATEAKDAVKTILRQINAVVYEDQSTGLANLKLLRNDYTIADLPVIGPDQVIEVRKFTKKLWAETNNVVRVKYTDREGGYAQGKLATAKDSSLLRFQKRQRPLEITMPGVFVSDLANAIAARELSNLNVPLYSAELTLNREAVTLRPGDAFVFTWPEYGIDQMVMRAKRPNFGTLQSGSISISAVQDEFSLDTTVVSAPPISGYVPTTLAPVDISTFYIFELPAFLDYKSSLGTRVGYTRFASFVLAPSSYTLGYNAYIEETPDDVEVLSLAPYTPNAKLAGPLGRFDGFATGIVGAITIKEVSDVAALALGDSERQGGGLIVIGNEILSYSSSTDNGDSTFDLNDVRRAMIDTGWFAHNTDDRVWFFNGAEGFFESDTLTGDTANVYFIDRTATGRSAVADATVTPETALGRVERVIAPDWATADGDRTPWQIFDPGDVVSIDARARSRLDLTELWFEDDAASTAEAGTTYRISFEVEGVTTVVADDEALPYNLTITEDMGGDCIIHVEAKKGGLYSIASTPMPIFVNSAALIIDGEIVRIDGERIDF